MNFKDKQIWKQRLQLTQRIGSWAERGSWFKTPDANQKLNCVLAAAKTPEHLQRSAKVALSKVLNPKMLKSGLAVHYRLIQGGILPSSKPSPKKKDSRKKLKSSLRRCFEMLKHFDGLNELIWEQHIK